MKHSLMLRIGPATFRIGSDWAEPSDRLGHLYANYPQPRDAFADFTVRLEAARPWRRWLRPSVTIAGDHMLAGAAPMALEHGLLAAEMGMNMQMALGWRRHVLLHASCVEKDGRAVVMTGESGSGKSTLAAMLGERGWRLMGDEFALLDPDSGHVFPFPRLVSLKNQAIGVMAAITPADRFGPLLKETPKGDIRHMIPRADATARMEEGARPAILLYPRYGHADAVRDVGQGESFMRLTQASTNYVAMGERGFDALTRFVGAVPARALDFADGDSGVAMVERLWEGAA